MVSKFYEEQSLVIDDQPFYIGEFFFPSNGQDDFDRGLFYSCLSKPWIPFIKLRPLNPSNS